MKVCAIHQPQFVPWLGYFDKIMQADIFVFLDNVQFKKNEFQNRNRILVNGQARWLTLPVRFSFGDTLREVRPVDDGKWPRRLWETVRQQYTRTPYFAQYGPTFHELLEGDWGHLAAINQATVEWGLQCLGIETDLCRASDLPQSDGQRSARLVAICRQVGADVYLSGAGGRAYLDTALFAAAGIEVRFQDFQHPAYPQVSAGAVSADFVSHLSLLDGLFNCGGGVQGRQALHLVPRQDFQ